MDDVPDLFVDGIDVLTHDGTVTIVLRRTDPAGGPPPFAITVVGRIRMSRVTADQLSEMLSGAALQLPGPKH